MNNYSIIENIRCVVDGRKTKIVFYTEEMLFNVRLIINGNIYSEGFNDKEPYDRLNHFFHISNDDLKLNKEALLSGKDVSGDYYEEKVNIDNVRIESRSSILKENDNKYRIIKKETVELDKGLSISYLDLTDKHSIPAKAFIFKINPLYYTLYTGTPNDDYKCGNILSTVPDMAKSAMDNGINVAGAVNADFFDIFGNGKPSGICIKNGQIIANSKSQRPFIGIDNEGKAVIATPISKNIKMENIIHAVSGLQMLVKNGRLFEWGILEPFAYVRHPRTAAGIDSNGNILLCVVDGRQEEYSNGASLVDLSRLMILFGAKTAINLDGGGSSCVYVNENGKFNLKNKPADLFKPRDMLIREEYNCILITKK